MKEEKFKILDYNMCKKKADINNFKEVDNVKIKVSYFLNDKVDFYKDTLIFEEEKFFCNGFEQLKDESITGAILFGITLEVPNHKFKSLVEEIEFSIWKNKLLDGGRSYFRELLSKKYNISNDFGPGFWGMKIEEIKKIFPYVNLKEMGMTLKESGVIVPETSCVGIYLIGEKPIKKLNNECMFCSGNSGGCHLCFINNCSGDCKNCGRCVDFVESEVEKKSIYLPKEIKRDKYESQYGMAIDIGSTNIEIALVELKTGNIINVLSDVNPQVALGTDVLTRISKAPIKNIREKTIVGINKIIGEFNIAKEEIKKVVIAGNTIMTQIFLEKEEAEYGVLNKMLGASSGLLVASDCEVIVLPNIGGFVGGDITAGIIAAELKKNKENCLFVDIGTNGEIVLKNTNGKFFACSTAAGPAFEGASLYNGMPSKRGGIVKIEMGASIKLETIGEEEPKGICGTGVLDAIGNMKMLGIINHQGTINEGINRVRVGTQGKEFVLYFGEKDIVITQEDIRQIQMAKAAIYSGIEALLEEAKIEEKDLKRIFLAGSFGTNINKKMAREIGLLPKNGEIIPRGNTALVGSLMILLDKSLENEAINLSKNVVYVEIAKKESFQRRYIENMNF